MDRMRMTAAAVLAATFLLVLLPAARPQTQNAYCIPHIANGRFDGGSFRTTFVIFNTTDSYFFFRPLKFTDDNGNPLSLTIPGLGSGAEFSLVIPGASTQFRETDGAGDLVGGAATLTAGAGLGVSAVFSVYDAAGRLSSEVGVASATPASEFVVPVDTVGLSNTGLALFNTGTGSASVDLILRGLDGQERGRTHFDMNKGTHLARFVYGPGQWFPEVGEFRGTLTVQSTVPIASLGLKQNGASPAYTSVPTVPKSAAKLSMNFPHVANGSFGTGSFRTSFVIFNTSATGANVDLTLTGDDGSPLTVTIPGHGTGSSFNYRLDSGAAAFVQTDGTGPLRSGAATITSNVAVGASGMFSVFDAAGKLQTEAGVGDSPILKNMTVPVNVVGNRNTGVAFFNPGSSGAAVTLRLIDDKGTIVGRDISFALGGKSHTAKFATDWFPTLTDFTGTLTMTSDKDIAALTLRQYSAPGVLSYTTLPLASGTAQGTAPEARLLPVTRTGISATAHTTVDQMLPQGFLLSGSVMGATNSSTEVWARRNSDGFTARSYLSGGRYLLTVGPGLYTVGADSNLQAGTLGWISTIYTDPRPVEISTDASRDLAVPFATLAPVTGTITGLDTAFPSIPFFTVAVFTSNDGKRQGAFQLSSDGSYAGALPPGDYQVGLSMYDLQLNSDQKQRVQIHNIGSVTVPEGGTTWSVSLPPMTKITGTVGGSALTASLAWAVAALDTSWIQDTRAHLLDPPAMHVGTSSTSSYRIIVARGRNYDVRAAVVLWASEYPAIISFPKAPNIMSSQQDMEVNFTAPELPPAVAVSGRISDPLGRPIAEAGISVYSENIAGAPDISFESATRTDSTGRYSIKVLSGSDYQMAITPPPIKR